MIRLINVRGKHGVYTRREATHCRWAESVQAIECVTADLLRQGQSEGASWSGASVYCCPCWPNLIRWRSETFKK